MNTTKRPNIVVPDGGPLAVCINDCQLDYGQRRSELARVCFQVRCAFAEMRWGSSAAAAFNAINLTVDENHTTPPR
jgi:hypothetical protein